MVVDCAESMDSALGLHYHFVCVLGADETGEPLHHMGARSVSVQAEGVFAGATGYWEGSNDGVHYHTILNTHGVAMTGGAPGIMTTRDMVHYMRARISGGGPTTQVTFTAIIQE